MVDLAVLVDENVNDVQSVREGVEHFAIGKVDNMNNCNRTYKKKHMSHRKTCYCFTVFFLYVILTYYMLLLTFSIDSVQNSEVIVAQGKCLLVQKLSSEARELGVA